MKTSIFIRAQVDGKWGNYDIGDSRLPDSEVVKWVDEQAHLNAHFLARLVLTLLGRQWR